jgi:NMD protein affecting ribosome stability and mRNA decay
VNPTATCPRCGSGIEHLMVNSRLCGVCYRAAIRAVPRETIVDEDRRFREAVESSQKQIVQR